MASPILKRGYKANLKADIEDLVFLGVDYWKTTGKFLTHNQLKSMFGAWRQDDTGEAWEQWMKENFPEALEDMDRVIEQMGEDQKFEDE